MRAVAVIVLEAEFMQLANFIDDIEPKPHAGGFLVFISDKGLLIVLE